jgi:hypothetical protein
MPSQYSRLGAAFRLKCARCRQGAMFVSKNSYDLANFSKMYKKCPNCGQPFEPEAGFYYGAMFLSYAIGVVQTLILFAIFNFVFGIDTLWSFIIVAVIWIGMSPYLFRFSRALWLSLFVNYHRDI